MLALCAFFAGVLCAENTSAVDFAEAVTRDVWIRHPVLGDVSYDAFEHAAGNPVLRGTPPYEWPVNGSLFEDPVSKHWFLYAGEYCKGYAIIPDCTPRCTVFRSTDRGMHWEKAGPIFEAPFTFEGEVSPTTHAPDVAVFFSEGRYHLCFDWATDTTTWANAANPPIDANSGAGYAWAEQPEGPFHPALRPIATTRNQKTLLGKYRRLYGSTMIRRAQDWLVLTLTDSGPHFGWGLVGMTASQPEGPYTEPKLLMHPETMRYYPPLLEFFPAFVQEGYIYSPATSVAMNRNYQALFRAPIENAMDPDAWELFQEGSIWHAEPVENESFGIWGQTFSGFVGDDGVFQVMFPSRDRAGNGTINLASRPWNQPFRARGCVLSGHEGPSLACLKQGGPVQHIESSLAVHGTAALIWDYQGALGANRASSGSTLHPLVMRRFSGLEISESKWRLFHTDAEGQQETWAEGPLESSGEHMVDIAWNAEAMAAVDGKNVFSGMLPNGAGLMGLWTDKNSHLSVNQLKVTGAHAPGSICYLYTDALLGMAQNMADWEVVKSPLFRYGEGARAKREGVAVKWNVIGSDFAVWMPRGPQFGQAEILVDGVKQTSVDLHAEREEPSQARYRGKFASGRHTICLTSVTAGMPVDVLEVTF